MSAQAMEDKVAEMSPVKKFIFNVAYVRPGDGSETT